MLEYIYMIYKIYLLSKEIPLVNIARHIYTAHTAYKARYDTRKRLSRTRNC